MNEGQAFLLPFHGRSEDQQHIRSPAASGIRRFRTDLSNPELPGRDGAERTEGISSWQYAGLSEWSFADKVEYPARCSTCGRRDILIHFVTTHRNPVADQYSLKSDLDE